MDNTIPTDRRRRRSDTGLRSAGLRTLSLAAVVALIALLAPGGAGTPAVAQNGEAPSFRDNPVDGGWVGLMRFGNRLLPLQINVNARQGGGLVQAILPEDLGADEPGELQLHSAAETDSFVGSGGGDDGDDDGGGPGDDGDDDDFGDDDDDENDCCYGPEFQDQAEEDDEDERHLQFMIEIAADEDVDGDEDVDEEDVYERDFDLTLDEEEDVLVGNVTSTRPGERRGRVELRRMAADRPLQRLWTGTANVDGSGRGEVTLLLNQDDASAFPQVTQAMATNVTGRLWYDGRVGTIEDGQLDGSNLEATLSIPGSTDIELGGRLIRRDTRLRAQFDGRGGLLRPATTRGRPMSLRRVVDDEVAPGARTTVRIRARNLEGGALAHFDAAGMQVLAVEVVNPRILDVTVDVDPDLGGQEVSVLIVNVDGQEDSAVDAIAVTGDGNGDDDGGGGGAVSFAADVQPIFTANCALSGCHAGANPQEGQNLSEGQAYDNIVEVRSNQRPDLFRIDPGNPNDSYLVKKIRGDDDIEGARMPFARAPLSQAQIDTIVTWVREGAERN